MASSYKLIYILVFSLQISAVFFSKSFASPNGTTNDLTSLHFSTSIENWYLDNDTIQEIELVLPSGQNNYQWYQLEEAGLVPINGAVQNMILVNEPGLYFAEYDTPMNCHTASNYFLLTSATGIDTTVVLNVGDPLGNYQWYEDSGSGPGMIGGETEDTLTVISTTTPITYHAIATDGLSCSNQPHFTIIRLSFDLDTDGDGIVDFYDLDDDNDGILDINEQATATNDGDSDGDGISDELDLDSDDDGCPDVLEGDGTINRSDIENDTLIGGVDTLGIPIIVGSNGQGVGTSQDSTMQDIIDCAFPENDISLCSDGIDNDGDGLVDCMDGDCGSPDSISISFTNPNNCPNLNDGQITITALGSNLEYSINGGNSYQPSNIFNNVLAGGYNLRIRNASTGCFVDYAENPIVLLDPVCTEICNNGIDDDGDGLMDCADGDCGSPSVGIIDVFIPNNCPNLNNGQIIVSASGFDLEYSINGGAYQTSSIFSGLSTGDYTLQVRNSVTGCVVEYMGNPIRLNRINCFEICDNGIDDDGDGRIDCIDDDCIDAIQKVKLVAVPNQVNYQWYQSEGNTMEPIDGATLDTLVVTEPGLYFASYSDQVSCNTASDYFVLTSTNQVDTAVILDTGNSSDDFQWFRDDGTGAVAISGATNQTLAISSSTTATTYYAATTDGASCGDLPKFTVLRLSSQLDTDQDGIPDFSDLDDDNDGILDSLEQATAMNNGDTDGDCIADELDLDSDNDGCPDGVNCQGVAVNLKVFLQGALIGSPSQSLMRDDLRKENLIPETEPYSELEKFQHVGEGGGESVDPAIFVIADTNSIVDWVLVELRSSENVETVVATLSGLVQRNGNIIDANGNSNLIFENISVGDYYIGIRHRNHLAIITLNTYHLASPDIPFIDFTQNTTPIRGLYSTIQIDNTNRQAMWAGDLNNDESVIYQGPLNDVFFIFFRVIADVFNESFLSNFVSTGYTQYDFNLDGKTIYQGPGNDRAALLFNTILKHPVNDNKISNYTITIEDDDGN